MIDWAAVPPDAIFSYGRAPHRQTPTAERFIRGVVSAYQLYVCVGMIIAQIHQFAAQFDAPLVRTPYGPAERPFRLLLLWPDWLTKAVQQELINNDRQTQHH